jgi:hypothetical protein
MMAAMCFFIDQEPDTKEMRCVPSSWTAVSKIVPKKIWDDSGAGGGKPGSMWTVKKYIIDFFSWVICYLTFYYCALIVIVIRLIPWI